MDTIGTREVQQELTDNELVLKTCDGHEQAFEQLWNRYKRFIFVMCSGYLHDHQLAEDTTQEIGIIVFEKLSTLRDPKCFVGWLKITTRRKCLEVLRHLKVRKESTMKDEDVLESSVKYFEDESSVDPLVVQEESEAVLHCLRGLSNSDKKALELFYIQELSLLDMQEVLSKSEQRSIPLGTIKRRLHVARSRLSAIVPDYLHPNS